MRCRNCSATILKMAETVLIVDDHAAFRSFARALLEAEGFDVVAEADDGASGLAAFAELRPAVVVLDVQLPDIDGFQVAERLHEHADAPGGRARLDPRGVVLTTAACGASCRC
jgi:CheY-like chemotaxis protein